MDHIKSGKDEGGFEADGLYVQPTLFIRPDMKIMREEIFGLSQGYSCRSSILHMNGEVKTKPRMTLSCITRSSIFLRKVSGLFAVT